jgi:hypothetical protein
MIRAIMEMNDAISNCQGHKSPCKKRGTTESSEAMMPQMVFGRKCRMMPVIKHPIPTSIP